MPQKEKITVSNEELLKMYDDGMSYAKIGSLFGVSKQRVHQRIKMLREQQAKLAALRAKFNNTK